MIQMEIRGYSDDGIPLFALSLISFKVIRYLMPKPFNPILDSSDLGSQAFDFFTTHPARTMNSRFRQPAKRLESVLR